MELKSVEIKIEGLSPGLLMHRFPLEPIEAIEKKSVKDQAELACYRHDGELFIPGVNLWRSLTNGAGYIKGKGRAMLTKEACACLEVTPVRLMLGMKEFEIDSRPVRIKATQGTIVRHRPWLPKWSVEFTLTYDETLISAAQLRQIVDNSGRRVGVLDFRPPCKGPFGRFVVTKWDEISQDVKAA